MDFQKNVDFDVFNPKYLKKSNFPRNSERSMIYIASCSVRKDIFQENKMEGIVVLKIAQNPDKDCSKRRINISFKWRNRNSNIFYYILYFTWKINKRPDGP